MNPARSPVAIRLGKLAEAAQTGSLHLSGDSGGVIYVSAGDIVAADSRRTPSLAARIGAARLGAAGLGAAGLGPLERGWLATEATIDAAMELMSARPRHVRFAEPGAEPGPDLPGVPGLALTALLAEVTRRHRLLEQIAGVLTPDAPVVRNPRLRSRAVHVSDTQWAILLQLGQAATPRALAAELGQSVFGLTIEVYRMVLLDLVSTVEPRPEASRGRSALSFIRALA